MQFHSVKLKEFLEPFLPLMGRRERQHWGSFYVQGLLSGHGRKTVSGLAERPGGVQQPLHQFLSNSPWDWKPVRRALAQQLVHFTPRMAWVVNDVGFPRRGSHSVGVARQYCSDLDQERRCQVGICLSCVTDQGVFPLDFALYLPEEWTNDPVRRRKAGIPEGVTYQPKWRLAIDLVDRVRQWGIPLNLIMAGPEYGGVPEFRAALRDRELSYIVGIDYQLRVHHGEFSDYQEPQSVLELTEKLPDDFWVFHRTGMEELMKSRFAKVQVQAMPKMGRQDCPVELLVAEWPLVSRPTDFWLSNLLPDYPIEELAQWTEIQRKTEPALQQMKADLGLDHFEGRSWVGLHHHVTLVMLAYGFLVSETLRVGNTVQEQTIGDKWEKLPDDLKKEVVDYIDFLIQKYDIR